MGIEDWGLGRLMGLGIGDWGYWDWAQSPQSPIPNPPISYFKFFLNN